MPRASPNCSRSSTNSSFPPADPRSARRRHPRSPAPARRRRVRAGRRRGRRVRRVDRRPPCGPSSATAACTTTAAATSRRGWPSSRRRGASATGRCGSSPRSCAATTSARCRRWLGRLGFDCGRVDGILGPATARGARGLPAQLRPRRRRRVRAGDRAGPGDQRRPHRHRARRGGDPRARAARAPSAPRCGQLRVVVGQFGGLGPLARHVAQRPAPARRQGDHGRRARPVAPRRGGQPLRGHRLRRLRAARRRARPTVAYYATAGFESAGGRALAERIGTRRSTRVGALPAAATARDAPAGAARDADDGRRVLARAGAAGRRRRRRRSATPSSTRSPAWAAAPVPRLDRRRADRLTPADQDVSRVIHRVVHPLCVTRGDEVQSIDST